MEFLRPVDKPKIIRTRLYGDQEFSRFELELLHTPLLQRLYSLKQLGLTDKVFPDAVHARFNHVLGTTEVVERMAGRLLTWLRSNSDEYFDFAAPDSSAASVSAEDVATQLQERLPALRLMALLHDVTHAAFGHTLEDEVNVFDQKHDDPERQIRFFDALTAQLLYLWVTEQRLHPFDGSKLEDLSNLELSDSQREERRWAEELAEYLSADDRQALAVQLRQLEFAERLLVYIEFAHGQRPIQEAQPLLITTVVDLIGDNTPQLDLQLNRDLYMIDLVGNTICADLLDYSRRDADNAGLRVQFDDRFLRYLCLVSVTDILSPSRQPCIRTAIQIFTDKMRHDVLSEMSGVLKARYLIHERVLFHPTKCAAGAMLGTAVQLLSLRDLPGWMQVLGDEEFLRVLSALAANLDHFAARAEIQPDRPSGEIIRTTWPADRLMRELIENAVGWIVPSTAEAGRAITRDHLQTIKTRAAGARNVLARLTSRRFAKVAYRQRHAHHAGGDSDETLATTYCRSRDRYDLERKVETICNLPTGSISVHCPRRKTALKVAEVLVVGSDLKLVAQLRDVTKVSREGLEPYQREIRAIEEMYRSIWQFHAFLDAAYWDKQPLVAWAFELVLGFPNDKLLADELKKDSSGIYNVLAIDLKDEIPPKSLPEIIRRVDAEMQPRMRFGSDAADPRERLRAIIREAVAEPSRPEQLGLPGLRSI